MINRRFLYYKRYQSFLRDLNDLLVANDAIVFILNPLCIWTHGTLYPCAVDKSVEIDNLRQRTLSLESSSATLQQTVQTLSNMLSAIDQGNGEPVTIDLSGIISQILAKADSTTVSMLQDDVSTIQGQISDIQSAIQNLPPSLEDPVSTTNMITLSTGDYELLVQNNNVDPTVYYFTYEGEVTQPVSGDAWTFGGTFPITFTDGNSSNGIGSFPINLV